MTDFEIIAKRHDENGVVTHVKITVHSFMVESVIKWIEDGTDTCYTMYKGIRANVRVQEHPTTKRKFLISTADGVSGNNIDNLPDC